MDNKSAITLWFINSSRAIRIAWALEALSLPYTLHSTPRAKNGLAPAEWKKDIPTPLHKSPAIKDGDVVLHESGAILEYLCEKYDTAGELFPPNGNEAERNEVRIWLHAAEGTFAIHSLAILYARWSLPECAPPDYLPRMEESLSGNVKNDLSWLNETLKDQGAKGSEYLVGHKLSIADIMMHFTILFIYERKIVVQWGDNRYPEVEKWMKRIEATPSFVKTKKRTEFTMDGDFRK